MFSAGPRYARVENIFGKVFSVGPLDQTKEGLLGGLFSALSVLRCFKRVVVVVVVVESCILNQLSCCSCAMGTFREPRRRGKSAIGNRYQKNGEDTLH
jgi:hypothetical protein